LAIKHWVGSDKKKDVTFNKYHACMQYYYAKLIVLAGRTVVKYMYVVSVIRERM